MPQTRQVFIVHSFSLMTCLNIFYTLVLLCLLSFWKRNNALLWIWVSFVTVSEERAVCVSAQAKGSRERSQLLSASGSPFCKENETQIGHWEERGWSCVAQIERFLQLIALLNGEIKLLRKQVLL